MAKLNPGDPKELGMVEYRANPESVRKHVMRELYHIDANPRFATLQVFLEYNYRDLLPVAEEIWKS